MPSLKHRYIAKRPVRLVERKLGCDRAHGQVRVADRLIEIDPRQRPACYLDTLVHEAMHVLYPSLKGIVARDAREIAALLLRAGITGTEVYTDGGQSCSKVRHRAIHLAPAYFQHRPARNTATSEQAFGLL